MTLPAVTISELDGALGVLPPSEGRLYAVVGVSSSGPLDTPATYSRVKDLTATFGVGPAVEAAAHYIERYGRPVVFVRTGQTTDGAAGSVTQTGTGTSAVTVDTDPVFPLDDFEVYFLVVTGGTIGTGPLTFRYSLDGGRTMSPLVNLGTATTYTIPDSGVVLAFDTGDLDDGDTVSFRTTAPAPNSTELGTALDALKNTAIAWEQVHIACPIDATAFDAIEVKMASMVSAKKNRNWIGNVRVPTAGESEATYLSSLNTAFSAKATTHGGLCAGADETTSSVSGRKYMRPISHIVAALQASVSEEVNIADVNLGSLKGVSIRDANGNPKYHDESVNPGLDDARFITLRTVEGLAGVYVTRPRLFSAEGSDFQLVPHRRVMNLGRDALQAYFIRRLNKPILVSKATGFILESEALEIEAGALAVMRATLMAKPKASDVLFTLSRTDLLLSTKTLNGSARIVPLAYPEFINLDLGFYSPALQVVAV